MRFKRILSIIITASLLWSCNNKTKNENTDNFDVSTILTNVGDNIITPQYSELKNSITVLKNDFKEFNDSPEAANLTKLQISFKTAYSDWQGCSFVNFGNTNITTLRNVFNTYPTDTGNVNSTFTVDTLKLESLSYANAIGFPALDYILFQGSEIEIVNRLSGEANNFVQKNIDLMSTKSIAAFDFWNTSDDDYSTSFKADNKKANGSGFSDFVNGYIQDVEILKNGQLGYPAGKFELGTPKPNQSEALFSNYSLELFKAHLTNLENTYKGKDQLGTDGVGFDDYLNELGTKRDGKDLNELILGVFTSLQTKCASLSGSMNDAIANEKSTTDEIYVKIKELVAYLKVDMTNAVGVQIAYIDNDGD
jgi:uncharacterized protein